MLRRPAVTKLDVTRTTPSLCFILIFPFTGDQMYLTAFVTQCYVYCVLRETENVNTGVLNEGNVKVTVASLLAVSCGTIDIVLVVKYAVCLL